MRIPPGYYYCYSCMAGLLHSSRDAGIYGVYRRTGGLLYRDAGIQTAVYGVYRRSQAAAYVDVLFLEQRNIMMMIDAPCVLGVRQNPVVFALLHQYSSQYSIHLICQVL